MERSGNVFGGYKITKNKKLLVIFRGINTEYFKKSNVTEEKVERFNSTLKLDVHTFKILLPGRLTKWKGQEMFLEAIKLLKTKYYKTNFKAVILGSHQGRKVFFKKLISMVEQYRLKENVMFLSHCEEMPVAYKSADVIVSSSIEPEAFGRVAVEAQSMEKPIIASNIGGSNETIIDEKTGFLYEAGNAKSLSNKILKTLNMDETLLKSIGNEGRKNIVQKFNVEKMCFSTYSEYKRLLN